MLSNFKIFHTICAAQCTTQLYSSSTCLLTRQEKIHLHYKIMHGCLHVFETWLLEAKWNSCTKYTEIFATQEALFAFQLRTGNISQDSPVIFNYCV